MEIICPIDKTNECIQRISILVSSTTNEGFSLGSNVGGFGTNNNRGLFTSLFSGFSKNTSNLARKLAPPPRPIKPGFPEKFYIGLALLLPFIGFDIYIFLSAQSDKQSIPPGIIMIMILCTWPIFAIANGISVYKKNKIQYIELQNEWKQMIENWNKLYFCNKHGIIFNPSNETVYDIEEFTNNKNDILKKCF